MTTNVNYNQLIVEQTDRKSTLKSATIKDGEVLVVGQPVIGTGDPLVYEPMTDELQTINTGVILEDVDASGGEAPGQVLTGGGISINSINLSAMSVTVGSITAVALGVLNGDGLRVVDTIGAIKPCEEA
jgi:hypothetical protein